MNSLKTKTRKTITFSELKRLSFCNSPKLPKQVEFSGKVKGKTVRRVMWWTGIGWVEVNANEEKDPVLVVEG